jgi:pyridoxal phosphate enzyme (YggS family)
MTAGLAERIAQVRARIADAAHAVGRPADDVLLVAISKAFPAGECLEAVAHGVTDLGENRAQELREKHAILGDRARWHFVGPLQTNKVRIVVGSTALIHSVDRLEVAEAVARRAVRLGISQDVLIEVNLSGEKAKHGVDASSAAALVERVAALDGIAVRGLMTIPPLPDKPEDSRPYYKHLAALRDETAELIPEAVELSMGMTRDFDVAIEEGATIVRVGEAIFGPRRTP